MRRLLEVLVVALALVAPPSARADLSVTMTFATCHPGTHYKYVTLPYSQLAADLADAVTTGRDHPCVGDPFGPPSGDGIIDEIDVLCQLHWNAAQGWSTSISQLDYANSCGWASSTIVRVTFSGTENYSDHLDPRPDMGFFIGDVNRNCGENVVTFTGPCDPPFPGRWIAPVSTCRSQAELLHFPYNARYLKADEILCGEEGVDWVDADRNGRPDSCPNGLFDGVHAITVATWDCDHATQPATDHTWITRTIAPSIFGVLFGGTNFDLHPGDAYRVDFSPLQAPVFWNPPTNPCN